MKNSKNSKIQKFKDPKIQNFKYKKQKILKI